MATFEEFTDMIHKAFKIVEDRVHEDHEREKGTDATRPAKKNAKLMCVDEASYGDWIGEIARIKPKKRKNWSSHLTDQWGQRTRVRYEDKKFWNWCTHEQKWCEATTSERLQWAKNGEWIPTSYVGWVKCVAMELRKMGVSREITEAMCDAAISRVREANETHNHYRNHIVKVGQDVYG